MVGFYYGLGHATVSSWGNDLSEYMVVDSNIHGSVDSASCHHVGYLGSCLDAPGIS